MDLGNKNDNESLCTSKIFHSLKIELVDIFCTVYLLMHLEEFLQKEEPIPKKDSRYMTHTPTYTRSSAGPSMYGIFCIHCVPLIWSLGIPKGQ